MSRNGIASLNRSSKSISRGSESLNGWNSDIKFKGHEHWLSTKNSFSKYKEPRAFLVLFEKGELFLFLSIMPDIP